MAIKRIWHGWTTKENADKYQHILHEEVIPGIAAKQIPGYKGIEVLRLELETEVEFMTVMTFESLQNVIDFQGNDYRKAYVPDAAQNVLKRWDLEAVHYEVVSKTSY